MGGVAHVRRGVQTFSTLWLLFSCLNPDTGPCLNPLRRRVVVVIIIVQLNSTKPELRFSADSSPARRVSKICDGEKLWQWSRLEIRLNVFHRSPIPQNNSSSSL